MQGEVPVEVGCEDEGQGGEIGLVDEVGEEGVATPGMFAEAKGRLEVEDVTRLGDGFAG